MKKYICKFCGYIYDEEAEEIAFDELEDEWVCPMCEASKEDFELLDDKKDEKK